ncbi:MAG: reverse transcriptase/maturase family protein [Patescibacteria group bacterium]
MHFELKYKDIISIENLLEAWGEFVNGKRNRKDVQEFGRNLMGNMMLLHRDLVAKTYTHSFYKPFTIFDPKFHEIHKASVRDRLLHHAIYRKLYTFFDKTFAPDSYSCRLNKGTHKAMARFKSFAFEASKNHTKTVWVLKCDIRKFFASIDQITLLKILGLYISDKNVLKLLSEIIGSFYSTRPGVGLPLGNLTSQLFVNIYMNEFDQFMKHKIKAKYYIRYADDFVILDQDRNHLLNMIPKIAEFLEKNLKLSLHPDKVFVKTFSSGVDFLGWVHFSDHKIVRKVTERRMIKNISKNQSPGSIASYKGLLLHGNTYKLINELGFI